MQSVSLYIDYNLGFCQLWWYYFTCSEVWVCTGRMLISIIPIQLQELTPVFKVLINGTANILQETFLGYRQLHWGVVIIPKNFFFSILQYKLTLIDVELNANWRLRMSLLCQMPVTLQTASLSCCGRLKTTVKRKRKTTASAVIENTKHKCKWRTGTRWTKKIQIWWLSLTCPSA